MNELLFNILFFGLAFWIVGIVAYNKPNYKNNLLYIIWNIFIVYRNFFHWNLHKIVVFFYSILFGLVISSPFLALATFLLYKISWVLSPSWVVNFFSTWQIDYSILTSFLQNIGLFISTIVVLFIVISIFIFTFMYGYLLLQIVYKNYLEGNKLLIRANEYLNFKLIYKYLWVLARISLYLLIPVAVFLLYVFMILGLWFISETVKSIFSSWNLFIQIIHFTIFSSIIIYFLFLAFRMAFAYIALLYTTDLSREAKSYIKESFELTRWKVRKLIWLGIPFVLVSAIISYIFEYIATFGRLSANLSWIIEIFTVSWLSFMVYISIYHIFKNNNISQTQEKVIINNEEIIESDDKINKKEKTIPAKKEIKTVPKKSTKTKPKTKPKTSKAK